MEFEFEQIKAFFLEEAMELFEKIDVILLGAEDAGALAEGDVDSLFRFFHTLKGNSATVGLKKSADITHKLEGFLAKLKREKGDIQSGVVAALVDSVDAMRKTLLAELDDTLDENTAKIAADIVHAAVNMDSSPKIVAINATPEINTAKDAKKDQNQIKVDLSKVDFLMNSIGEIVITVSMLNKKVEEMTNSRSKSEIMEKIELLERQLKEMQDTAMAIRMVPIRQIYSKFPRQVRELSKSLGKKVELTQIGEDVEIDKAITDGLTDAFGHIVRNSLDHGIETPAERKACGKSETAKIMMEASQQNGQILIKIRDDGRGIDPLKVSKKAVEKGVITQTECDRMNDEERLRLIFAPGFSTAQSVTDISGRGVGMDVVLVNIEKLNGSVKIASEVGKYTVISITLPLTLAVLDGLSVGVGNREFILPVAVISETLQPQKEEIKKVGEGGGELLSLRGEFIPIIRVYKLLQIEPKTTKLEEGIALIVNYEDKKAALFVDEYRAEGQVAVKSIEKNFVKMAAFSAATVKPDGSIGLILDVGGLIDMQKQLEKKEVA